MRAHDSIPFAAAITATACAILAVAGCSRLAPGAARATDSVYVGVAVGLENPERYVDVFKGVQLALDDLNAKRPAGTPPLALRRAPADARTHLDVASAFVRDSSVVAVVGHTESEPTIDAAAIYEDRAEGGARAMAAVTPTANGTMVTRINDWIFRVAPLGTRQAEVLAHFAADSLRLRRMAVLYRNDASGKDFSRAFVETFARAGGTVVERDPFVEAFPEFEAYAIRMVRRGVQGVVIVGNAPEGRKAIHALRAAGGTPAVLVNNAPGASDTAALRDFRGVYYTQTFVATESGDTATTRFTRAFRGAFGHVPDQWGALSYDAAMLIGRAVHQAGADRRRVRDWIASVGRAREPYEGVTGRIRFDEHGDPIEKRVPVGTVGE